MTFQTLLDEVRHDIARQLLSATTLSLAAIARVLGYAGPETFPRAFHRWSGETPGRWRRMNRNDMRRALRGLASVSS